MQGTAEKPCHWDVHTLEYSFDPRQVGLTRAPSVEACFVTGTGGFQLLDTISHQHFSCAERCAGPAQWDGDGDGDGVTATWLSPTWVGHGADHAVPSEHPAGVDWGILHQEVIEKVETSPQAARMQLPATPGHTQVPQSRETQREVENQS